MGRLNFPFLFCCLFYMILVSSTKKADAKSSFNWQIKLNRSCTVGLYENDKTAEDYKDLKTLVENSISQLYKGWVYESSPYNLSLPHQVLNIKAEYKVSFNYRTTANKNYFAIDPSGTRSPEEGLQIYFPANGSLVKVNIPITVNESYFVEFIQEKVGDEYQNKIRANNRILYTTMNKNPGTHRTVLWSEKSDPLNAAVISDMALYYKRGNTNFLKSTLQLVNCNGTHLTVGLLTETKNISGLGLQAFNKIFKDNVRVNQSSASIMEDVLSYDLNAAVPLVKLNPSLYAKLGGNLAGGYFCQDRSGFKSKLASTLILSDGVSTANPSQVIINNHPCGVNDEALLSNVQFYVARASNMGQADIHLTNLAYKVVEQMIYDGTEWRLGLHLFKYLNSIELLGRAKKDPGLSDLDITYIGFGAVLGIIVLLILIILIVDCTRKRCCPDCCGGNDEKDFHVSVHDIESNSKEKGITNNLFQTEKAPAAVVEHHNAVDNNAYEDVGDPLVITPAVQVVPYEHEPPEYYELKKMDESPQPVVLGTFHDPIDEEIDEPLYENPVETEQADEELLTDPEFDSVSNASDICEGRELNVDDLANALSDENGLLIEFDHLGNRVPGPMLYPDDVVSKNRVPGCFPWPESRVPLCVDNPDEDYINASFVKDNKGAIAYIATQGPLESTTNDFWQMIMERKVEVIVMITPLSLRGQEMCHQYWPRDQAPCSYGDVTVQLTKKELKPDFLVMTVTASQGDVEPRQVYIYRYMSWPQSDIPDNSRSIVAFLLEIREVCETLHSFPLFHGSSGRGMTAVLLALYNGMISIEDTDVANIKKIVRRLRKDLPGAIESYEQYKFLYEALFQYAQFNNAS